MLVKNWMSAPPITIDMNDSMQDAIKLIRENSINMLPVINKQRLVGVVTDGDLKRASASDATTLEIHELLYLITKIKIKDIMAKDPITVLPDFSVEETAEVLLKNRISGVPVMVVNPYKIVTQNKNKTDAIPHLVNYYMAFKMLVPYRVVKPL